MRFFAVFILIIRNASCLASSSSSSSSSALQQACNDASLVISTKRNGGHSQRFYLKDTSIQAKEKQQQQQQQVLHHNLSSTFQRQWHILRSRSISSLRSTFLPVGFPHSVPRGYLSYSVWSWLQDWSTSLRAVLATQRVLQGVGVGTATATALSATQNFLVRDAAGMVATLFFTAAAAGQFSNDVKRWRLLADVLVDIGITLEVLAVQLPRSLFLPALCLANMCKAMCGVAAGACGGSIAVFWTSRGTDISDINAKFGAQHTVTAGLGLLFAALFAQSVATTRSWVVWILYFALTALHLLANRRCMRIIAFTNMNQIRLNMILSEFLDKWSRAEATSSISTPEEIASREPLLFGYDGNKQSKRVPVYFGVSFNEFVERSCGCDAQANNKEEFVTDILSSISTEQQYAISIGRIKRSTPCIVVSLLDKCTRLEKIKAYFHSSLLCRTIEQVELQRNVSCTGRVLLTDADLLVANQVASEDLSNAWSTFIYECGVAGWNLNQSELQGNGYEITIR